MKGRIAELIAHHPPTDASGGMVAQAIARTVDLTAAIDLVLAGGCGGASYSGSNIGPCDRDGGDRVTPSHPCARRGRVSSPREMPAPAHRALS